MGNQNENPSDIRRSGNPGGQNDYGQNYGNANPVNLAGRGQPYFTGSAPNSSQPQGGGRYPGTPDQRQHQPPKQKKPVSKLAIFVAIEAIAAVALFAGAYKITSDRLPSSCVSIPVIPNHMVLHPHTSHPPTFFPLPIETPFKTHKQN